MYKFEFRCIRTLMFVSFRRKIYTVLPVNKIHLRPMLHKNLFIPYSSLNFLNNFLTVKFYSHDETSISDSESSNDEFSSPKTTYLRQLLYPNSTDDFTKTINSCASIQAILNFINENENSLEVKHICQIIIVLWDLQKTYFDFNRNLEYDEKILNEENALKHFQKTIIAHSDFKKIFRLVEEKYNDFNNEELVFTLLYLNKIGIELRDPIMQKIVYKLEKYLDSSDDVPLSIISRYAVAVFSHSSYWSVLVSRSLLSRVNNSLETCESFEDLSLITTCLKKMKRVVGPELIKKYSECIIKIMRNQKHAIKKNYKIVIKCIQFLNNRHWSSQYISLNRDLILAIRDCVNEMDGEDIIKLNQVFIMQLEPADVIREVQNHASKLYSNHDNNSQLSRETAPELLSCIAPFSSPKKRKMFEDLTRSYIKNDALPKSTVALFRILRHSKTSDINLCDMFWSKTIEHLKRDAGYIYDGKLLKICYDYMNFNNNLGGTYRNITFEKQMIQWLEEEINYGLCGIVPSTFSKAASFILAYGLNNDHRHLLELVLNKLSNMNEQINYMGCLYLSRSLRIATEFNKGNKDSEIFKTTHRKVKSILEHCIEKQLNNYDSMNMHKINALLHTFINIKSNNTEQFKKMINKYVNLLESDRISSYFLREISFVLESSNCLVPEILEQFVNYVILQKRHLLGNVVANILYLCYDLGYLPQNSTEFAKISSEVIEADKFEMNGLPLLKASIALCFFQELPESLVRYIFSEEFLEQLDEEIKFCYSKVSYPIRIRDQLMQLNRAICLDYPEMEIPWFHQKYCDEIAIKAKSTRSVLFCNVLSVLSEAVGGREYIKADVLSPYNYKIDYLLYLDRYNKPVPIKDASESHKKVAILLLNIPTFTNLSRELKGQHQLKNRHLEMLGYKNIFINSRVWNCDYLSKPHQKLEYIKAQLGLEL